MVPGLDPLALLPEPFQPDAPTVAETTAPAPEPAPLRLVADPAPGEDPDRVRRALLARFGDGFPLAMEAPVDDDWVAWADGRWEAHQSAPSLRVHLARRNRLIRDGVQWIASYNGGPWQPPPRPSSKVRAVVNMIGPALDWRLQVQTEQRPGVQAIPLTRDPDDQRRAVAANAFLEYQMRTQNLRLIRREAARWAQTDGVSFLCDYWDVDAGPLVRDPDTGAAMRAGDCATRVLTIESVRVSANATASVAPHYWVVNEPMALADALAEYGPSVVDEGAGGGSGRRGVGLVNQPSTGRANDLTGPGSLRAAAERDRRLDGQATVQRRMVFCAPCGVLPHGLALIVIGQQVVSVSGLLSGKVPLTRYADGSSDPAFFARPQMDDWLDDQMRLNQAYSLLLQNVATNAGGRFMARQGVVKPDTLAGGQDVHVEVRSASPLDDVIRPIQGFTIGQDALAVIQGAIKRLEDMTGYNDVARGGVDNASSGKAIYAIREQIERVFAPAVYAESDGIREWADHTLALAARCYHVPRAIRTLGKSRPDLGRLLTGDDLDGAFDIDLDPSTLMPTPASVKRSQLDDLFAKGLVKPHEYVRRYGFGVLDGIEYPDETHANRAYRWVDAARTHDQQGQDPAQADQDEPLLWMDDEAIWQDVLDRELILAPDIAPPLRAAAIDRWIALATQAQRKMSTTPQMGLVPSPFDPMNPERGALAAPPAPAPPMAAPPGAPPADPMAGSAPAASPPAPMAPAPSGVPAGPPTAGESALPLDQGATPSQPGSPLAADPALLNLVAHQAAQRLAGQTPT